MRAHQKKAAMRCRMAAVVFAWLGWCYCLAASLSADVVVVVAPCMDEIT